MKLIANQSLPREAQAFLMALYVGESGGDYTILFTGKPFDMTTPHFTAPPWVHPNRPIPIPNSDLHSTAAGAAQFLYSTWLKVQRICGLADFSPENQDAAAWWLAQDDYHRRTGNSLLAMLRGGDVQGIATELRETWTSLDETRFPARYAAALAMIPASPPQPTPQPSPAPAASTAPQEGIPMNWLMARLNEPSTHAAVAAIAAAVASTTTGPVQQIALLVAALFGGAGIVKKAA